MDSQADVLRRREAEAREKLRRLTDALSAGIDPAALIGPINAAQADADSARVQLNALDAPAPVPAHEQVEQALEMLGDHVEDALSADRSPPAARVLREHWTGSDLAPRCPASLRQARSGARRSRPHDYLKDPY